MSDNFGKTESMLNASNGVARLFGREQVRHPGLNEHRDPARWVHRARGRHHADLVQGRVRAAARVKRRNGAALSLVETRNAALSLVERPRASRRYRFSRLLYATKPDVVTGYNSDAFDLPYILERAANPSAQKLSHSDNSVFQNVFSVEMCKQKS